MLVSFVLINVVMSSYRTFLYKKDKGLSEPNLRTQHQDL